MARLSILAFGFWLLAFSAGATEIKEVEANGVKAWVVQDNVLPIISIEVAFRNAGSSHDPAAKQGLAYEVASMLNEGAGEYSSHEYQKLLEENAINFSPDVDRDNFYISVKTLTENLPLAVKLTNLSLTKARFTPDDFARIKGQTLSIIKKSDEDEGHVAARKFAELEFGSHPYAQPKEGRVETIEALAPQDLHEFAKAGFAKDNIVVSIVGDIDEESAKAILAGITEGLPATAGVKPLPPVTAYPKGQVAKVKMNNPQTYVIFGEKGITRSDPDYYAAYILNHILGGDGFSARLMTEVREKNGLAYSVGTQLQNLKNADLMTGVVSTKTESVDRSIRIITDEYAKIAKKGVSPRELKDAKDYITGSFGLNLDKNENLASFLISMQVYNLGRDYLDKRNNYFKTVTIEQVNRLAKRLIVAENLVFVKVGM